MAHDTVGRRITRPGVALALVIALAGCKGTFGVPTKPPTLTTSGANLSGLGGAVLLTVSGQVLGLDGRPAPNVAIAVGAITDSAGVITDAGAAIANNGGSIVSDNGAAAVDTGLTAKAKRRLLADAGVRTDANGRFSLKAPAGTAVVVEATGDHLAAIQPNVKPGAGELRLQLAPTGTVSGRVTVPDQPTVTDLTGIDVFLPGTGHIAKTDAAGNFTLEGMPAGDYVLAARRDGLGRGSVAVSVQANERTTTAVLALVQNKATIAAAVPPIAAPGVDVEIHGDGFGASSGEAFQVTLAGAVLTTAARADDHTIRVTLPANATAGDLVVTVGGVPGAPLPYAVARRLVPLPGRDALLAGETLVLEARAVDADGHPLGDVPASWSATGDGADLDGSHATAHASGTANFTCTLGSLSASVELPVRPAIALPRLLADTASARLDGLSLDARSGKLLSVDSGEGAAVRVVAIDASSGSTSTLDSTGTTPHEVAAAPDGTRYVIAADSSLWAFAPGAQGRKLLDAAAMRAAIPTPPPGGQTPPGGQLPPGGQMPPGGQLPPGGQMPPAPGASAPPMPGGAGPVPGGPPLSAGDVPTAHGLAIDAAGHPAFFLLPGLVIRYDGTKATGVPLAPPQALQQGGTAYALAGGPDGLIAFLPRPGLAPALLTLSDGPRHEPVALAQDVGTVAGMAADAHGHIFVASTSQHAIYELDAAGGARVLAGHPGDTANDWGGPHTPGALAVDADGTTLWALDGDHPGRIWRFAIQRATP